MTYGLWPHISDNSDNHEYHDKGYTVIGRVWQMVDDKYQCLINIDEWLMVPNFQALSSNNRLATTSAVSNHVQRPLGAAPNALSQTQLSAIDVHGGNLACWELGGTAPLGFGDPLRNRHGLRCFICGQASH